MGAVPLNPNDSSNAIAYSDDTHHNPYMHAAATTTATNAHAFPERKRMSVQSTPSGGALLKQPVSGRRMTQLVRPAILDSPCE
jgi:hypothetical protein